MFKNFKFIGIVCLVLVAMVVFSSCSKPEKQIIGKWKITAASLKVYGEEYGRDDKGETWIFKDNGKCVLHVMDIECEGKYTVKKNTLTIDIENEDPDVGGAASYNFFGNLDIEEISKDEMSISGTIDFYGWDFGQGIHKAKFSYEFEKK